MSGCSTFESGPEPSVIFQPPATRRHGIVNGISPESHWMPRFSDTCRSGGFAGSTPMNPLASRPASSGTTGMQPAPPNGKVAARSPAIARTSGQIPGQFLTARNNTIQVARENIRQIKPHAWSNHLRPPAFPPAARYTATEPMTTRPTCANHPASQ